MDHAVCGLQLYFAHLYYLVCSHPGNDTCDLEPVTGPCLAYFPSYFYNSTTGNCEMFVYGGCQGNDNRFETVSDCLEACGGIQVTDGKSAFLGDYLIDLCSYLATHNL